MGNILSLIFGKSKASTSHDSREKTLGFQQYKSLVGETSKPDPGLVTRKGSDARSIVDKIPVYKRLYKETRQRDERLSSLDAEVKLNEMRLRKEAHIIKVEEEQEVTILSSFLNFFLALKH